MRLTPARTMTGGFGVKTNLKFSVQPSDQTPSTSISPSITVLIKGINNNTVTSATDVVTLSLNSGTWGGVIGGTVSAAAVGGVATFSNITVSAYGLAYTLSASATGLAGDTSSTFNVLASGVEQLLYGPVAQINTSYNILSPNGVMWTMDTGTGPGWILRAVDIATQTILTTITLSGSAPLYAIPFYVDSSNNLWAWNYGGGFANATVWRFSTDGTAISLTATAAAFPTFVKENSAVDSDGNIWIGNQTGAYKLSNIDVTDPGLTLTNTYYTDAALAQAQPIPNGGAVAGRMYCVSPSNTGNLGVGYFNTTTGAITRVIVATGIFQPAAVMDNAGYIYTGHQDTPTIIEQYDSAGTSVNTCVIANVSAVNKIVANNAGSIYVEVTLSLQKWVIQIATATMTETMRVQMPTNHNLSVNQSNTLYEHGVVTDITSGAFAIYAI